MLPSALFRYERQWRNLVISSWNVPGFCAVAGRLRLTLLYVFSVGRLLQLRQRRAAQNLHHGHHHRHSHRNHLHNLLRALHGFQLPRQVSTHAVENHSLLSAELMAATLAIFLMSSPDWWCARLSRPPLRWDKMWSRNPLHLRRGHLRWTALRGENWKSTGAWQGRKGPTAMSWRDFSLNTTYKTHPLWVSGG